MIKNKCIDCNKLCSPKAKRCSICSRKENGRLLKLKFRIKYKGILLDIKKDVCKCGKVKNKKSKTCQFCYFKIINNKGKGKGRKIIKFCKCGKKLSRNYYDRCKKCAGKTQKGKNNPMFGKIAHHGKWIKYKSINMRSTWEVAYAKYLDKQGIKWLYEHKTFDLGKCTYTPDFYLPESDTYVEIKGWWRDDAKKKFKMFQKKYCSMNIILLMQKELKKLKVIK
jgi:hypothetical protein